jgi:hypothetical protein
MTRRREPHAGLRQGAARLCGSGSAGGTSCSPRHRCASRSSATLWLHAGVFSTGTGDRVAVAGFGRAVARAGLLRWLVVWSFSAAASRSLRAQPADARARLLRRVRRALPAMLRLGVVEWR